MKTAWIVSCVAATLACGGGSGGAGSGNVVNGTVSGVTIAVADSASLALTAPCFGNLTPTPYAVQVNMGTHTGICSLAQQSKTPGNESDIGLTLVKFYNGTGTAPASTPVITAGTYPINSNPANDSAGFAVGAVASLDSTDATCSSKIGGPLSATGGSITITSIDAGSVQGTFTATFTGGTMTGTFNSPICSVTAAQVCASTSSQTCSP